MANSVKVPRPPGNNSQYVKAMEQQTLRHRERARGRKPRHTGAWCMTCTYCYEYLSEDGVSADPALAVSMPKDELAAFARSVGWVCAQRRTFSGEDHNHTCPDCRANKLAGDVFAKSREQIMRAYLETANAKHEKKEVRAGGQKQKR